VRWLVATLILSLIVFGAIPIGILTIGAVMVAPAVAEQVRQDPCSAYDTTTTLAATTRTSGFALPKWGTPRHQSLTSPAQTIPAAVKALYVAAAAHYRVPWQLLAGIGMAETRHGRNNHTSSAGAQGLMQFMPGTFAAYGVDGNQDGRRDIDSDADSIFSAANYLVHSGVRTGPAGVIRALWAYNRSVSYRNDVLYYAWSYAGHAGVVVGTGDPADCLPPRRHPARLRRHLPTLTFGSRARPARHGAARAALRQCRVPRDHVHGRAAVGLVVDVRLLRPLHRAGGRLHDPEMVQPGRQRLRVAGRALGPGTRQSAAGEVRHLRRPQMGAHRQRGLAALPAPLRQHQPHPGPPRPRTRLLLQPLEAEEPAMTMLQADRRRNPYPYTWEIPIGILTGWLLLAGIGIQLGRSLANATAGAGWAWPSGRALYTSLPAVLAGDPTAGLALAGGAASLANLQAWLIVTQLVILAGYTTALVWAGRRWGPGRMKGMASPAEAEEVLGLTRLRRNATLIRPDLHPTTRRGPS
jgi:hypothetical protein